MSRNSNIGSLDIRPVANALAAAPGTIANLTADALLSIQDALDSLASSLVHTAGNAKSDVNSLLQSLEGLAGSGLSWDATTGTITIAFGTLDDTIFRQFGIHNPQVLGDSVIARVGLFTDGVLSRSGIFGVAVIEDAAIKSASISKLLAGAAHFLGTARFQSGFSGPFVDIDSTGVAIDSGGLTPHNVLINPDGMTITGPPGLPILYSAGETVISSDTLFTGTVVAANGYSIGLDAGWTGSFDLTLTGVVTVKHGLITAVA